MLARVVAWEQAAPWRERCWPRPGSRPQWGRRAGRGLVALIRHRVSSAGPRGSKGPYATASASAHHGSQRFAGLESMSALDEAFVQREKLYICKEGIWKLGSVATWCEFLRERPEMLIPGGIDQEERGKRWSRNSVMIHSHGRKKFPRSRASLTPQSPCQPRIWQ